MVKRGNEVELEIESAAFEGAAVGRLEKLVVFTPFAVPGDRVKVRINRKHKKYAEGTLLEVLKPSPDRISPQCKYFGTCGGCKLQSTRYAVQLSSKRQQVEDLLRRIGKLEQVEVEPTCPSPDIYGYRNKMEFSFGASRWLTQEEIETGAPVKRDFALGLHIPKRFDRILDLEECFLQGELSPRIVNRVRQLAIEQKWTALDTKTYAGYLRNLVIRRGVLTGDLMVNLVTSSYEVERIALFTETLRSEFPEITTILNTINATRSPVPTGDEVYLTHGDGFISERIGPIEYRLSPTSFFQPNSKNAENLFSTIREFAQLSGDETVYDIYCGLGAIGLFLANTCRRVVGIEAQAESIEMARANAALNQIENCDFEVGDALEALSPDFLQKYGLPEIVVFDPPRIGLDRKLVDRVLELEIPRIVYSSCNPATQARDLEILRTRYHVDRVRPVDMFPQTYHIEAVASLTLKH